MGEKEEWEKENKRKKTKERKNTINCGQYQTIFLAMLQQDQVWQLNELDLNIQFQTFLKVRIIKVTELESVNMDD